VKIEWTGTKPTAATAANVNLDRFDVAGALVPPPPTISSLNPKSGSTLGGTSVVITGTNLSGASSVTFDGTNATSYIVNSATQITATTPAHAEGAARVQVTAPGGSTADTSADDYDYIVIPPPTITALSTATGTTTGGTGVIITGTGFTGATAVTFGGTAATRYTVNSATQIMAIAPAHAAGAVRVQVTAQGVPSADVPEDDFTYVVAPSTSMAEQTTTSLVWTGTWTLGSNTSYSGGSLRYINQAGSVTASFTGTYLAWIAKTSPAYGIAKVTLDGLRTYTVDLYSSTTLYQKKVFDTGILPSGLHSVKIEWTGTKPTAATAANVNLDRFDVAGALVTQYEQSDPRLLYAGIWSTTSSTSASGGDYTIGGSGAGLTVNFTGTGLDWIATLGPNMGNADVSVDGKAAILVNLYSATNVYQKDVFSTGDLPSGKHVLEISWDEANTTGTYISIDALDVAGSIPWELTLSSEQAKWVEQRLSDLSYRPGTIDGVFDTSTRGAIIAFQKWEGLTRDGEVSAAVLTRLGTATRPKPTRTGSTNPWIEVDKTKQVLLYCKDGAVVWTLPVSTGSASVGIVTPSGTFTVTRKTLETSPRYLPLYISNYPTSLLAIHGYTNVPTSPASHGCIRTQIWDEDALYPLIVVGTYVYIY
jgi:peptidoglycan hydrolase-like protein with peptidoglycan-binding domain